MSTKSREGHLRRTYGITEEQYDELFQKQDGACAVCRRAASEFDRRLAVDHNHKSGEIRGLLCNFCNHRLVGRHTDAELLRQIARYLENTTGWFVPPKVKKRKPRKPRAPRAPRKAKNEKA